jgi:hypothetical protein
MISTRDIIRVATNFIFVCRQNFKYQIKFHMQKWKILSLNELITKDVRQFKHCNDIKIKSNILMFKSFLTYI